MIKLTSIAAALLCTIVVVAQLQAQTKTITGTVTDMASGKALAGVKITAKGTKNTTLTKPDGKFSLQLPASHQVLVFSLKNYVTKEVTIGKSTVLNVKLRPKPADQEVVLSAPAPKQSPSVKFSPPAIKKREQGADLIQYESSGMALEEKALGFADQSELAFSNEEEPISFNTENYDAIRENGFLEPTKNPLSTFSIDVDKASYANVRRFLNYGQKPPKDAVRIEELINYFTYDYPEPKGKAPFAVHTELSACPWNKQNQLLHIGIQGKKLPTENLPPANLVFLIDVSGSMNEPNKLPLVIAGFKLLVNELRPQDKVAIVVYAGAAGQVLPATPGNQKSQILAALDKLQAGGSTAGGEGIKLAYKIAQENFRKGGNNRVILATDGDFNVGVSSDAEMERLIEQKRESGVFLTVLGFGTGNLKDSRMEKIADKGNGNYSYVDNILEAKKVFVSEFGGTLFTIAKDVKLQLEFNPTKVKGYRLIGYENRALRNEDFNNDKKDAGDLGSGHTVTALYEIIPANALFAGNQLNSVDPLKYQQTNLVPKMTNSNDLLTLKLRYKEPDGQKSSLIETVVPSLPVAVDKTSENFRFAAAVAQFGMLLRDSEFKGNTSYDNVLAQAQQAKGKDEEGYRQEFINLVKAAKTVNGAAAKR